MMYLRNRDRSSRGGQPPSPVAEPDRDPHLLVQVCDTHLEPLPHRGGKGPEGHAPQDQRVDLPDRGGPSPFPADTEGLFRREDPAEEGPELEFVAARVERGVGQHGDADELDLVQQAGAHVPPPAPLPRVAPLVDMEPELVRFFVVNRRDRPVGADHGAHPAADAGMGGIGVLPDTVIDAEKISRFFRQPQFHLEGPHAMNAQSDGLDGTDRGAAAAERAFLLAPEDLPGEILRA